MILMIMTVGICNSLIAKVISQVRTIDFILCHSNLHALHTNKYIVTIHVIKQFSITIGSISTYRSDFTKTWLYQLQILPLL